MPSKEQDERNCQLLALACSNGFEINNRESFEEVMISAIIFLKENQIPF